MMENFLEDVSPKILIVIISGLVTFLGIVLSSVAVWLRNSYVAQSGANSLRMGTMETEMQNLKSAIVLLPLRMEKVQFSINQDLNLSQKMICDTFKAESEKFRDRTMALEKHSYEIEILLNTQCEKWKGYADLLGSKLESIRHEYGRVIDLDRKDIEELKKENRLIKHHVTKITTVLVNNKMITKKT